MILKGKTYDIQEGDIILVHTKKGFIPKAIRLFTKCHYNHAALVVEAFGELCIVEAIGRGLMITKTLKEYLEETPDKRGILVLRASDKLDRSNFYVRLKDIIGHAYDFKSLFYSQVIQQLTKRYRWKGPRNVKASKRLYCSEACAYVYPNIFPNWWAIAPVDIYKEKKLREVFKLN